MKDLDKYTDTLSKYLDKRAKKAEKAIKKLYLELAKSVVAEVGKIYQKYEKDGKLSYADMMKYNRLNNFMNTITYQVNTVHTEYRSALDRVMGESYEYSYDWVSWAIQKETAAKIARTKLRMAQIARAKQNEMLKVKLRARLEQQRAVVIDAIRKEIVRGMTEGQTYKQTATEVKKQVNGDYKKAIRIVRTETHRVREQASVEAASYANANGVIMGKKWSCMKDERVRTGKANHLALHGQEKPVDEPFDLGGGRQGMSPGNTGYAFEDINCRCITRLVVLRVEAQTDEQMAKRTFKEYQALEEGAV